MRMAKNASELDLLTRTAWLYYKEDMTQDEIAGRLHLSRSKVVRLLKRPRMRGLFISR